MKGYSLTKSETSDQVKDWGFRFFQISLFQMSGAQNVGPPAQGNLPLQGGAPPQGAAPPQGVNPPQVVPAPVDAAAGAPQGVPAPQGVFPPQGVAPNLLQGAPHQIPGFQGQAQGFVGAGGLGPFAVNGNGMNNVQLNGNMFMNIAAFADHKANLAMQTVDTLAKAQKRADRWSRDLCIKQEKAQFRSPSDKKAIEYLVEEKFDLKELL